MLRIVTNFFLAYWHPTFYVLPVSLQAFLDAESLVAAELSPEVAVSAVEPEVVSVAELSPEVAVLVVEPEVVVLVVGAAEPQASADIAVVFVVLVPVSVAVVEVGSSGRPKFLAFPNVDHFASPSSSAELVG
jgi:hypothetical protein